MGGVPCAGEQCHKTENALSKGLEWPARKQAFFFMCEGCDVEKKKGRRETNSIRQASCQGHLLTLFCKILQPTLRGRCYYPIY